MKKLLTAALLSVAAANANANLVTNGSFESGLSGWNCSGADLCTTSSDARRTGSAGAYGYDNSGFATLSQTLSTVVGASYGFSFFSNAYQTSGNELRYSFSDFSGSTLVPTTTQWLQTTGSFVATSTSTLMQFFFATDPGTGTWRLDDVSVEQIAAPVPEPETYAMLLAGLGLMAGFVRRRKARQAA